MSTAKNGPGAPVYKITQFTGIPASMLVHLVITAHDDPAAQRQALAELAKLSPQRRGSHLILALRHMVEQPQRYEPDIMASIVELLATDPSPDATRAMIEVLPAIARAQKKGIGPLTLDLRAYFYQALATHRRDTDHEVWREMLPRLSGETLVDLLTDPAAEQIRELLSPMTLIKHLPREQRRQALRDVLLTGNVGQSLAALRLLLKDTTA